MSKSTSPPPRRRRAIAGCAGALVMAALAAGCAGSDSNSARQFPQEVAIRVTENGFVPGRSFVKRGRPVTLVVTRWTDQTCAKEIVVAGMPSRELPLDRAVLIELPDGITDSLEFECGMEMYHGVVIAR